MSVRPNPRTSTISAAPSEAIEFKNDFVNSTAALAASHDETVSHILQRLDQLQSKISNQPEAAAQQPVQLAARPIAQQKPAGGDLHARLQTLENIHEGSLRTLNSKLDGLERQLSNNKEAEVLMGRIASKFSAIESQLGANKEADALMNKIATKFTQVEARLQSATQLGDRISQLESRFQTQSKLQDRIQALESQLKTAVQPKLYELESRLEPSPEHDRILARINSKLEILEQNARSKKSVSLGATFDDGPRRVAETGPDSRSEDDAAFTGSNADREERIKFLQSRIEKLRELRSRYEVQA